MLAGVGDGGVILGATITVLVGTAEELIAELISGHRNSTPMAAKSKPIPQVFLPGVIVSFSTLIRSSPATVRKNPAMIKKTPT